MSDGKSAFIFGTTIAGIYGLLALEFTGLSDPDTARQALEDLGYQQIIHQGKADAKACGGLVRDSFNVVAPNGNRIIVAACRYYPWTKPVNVTVTHSNF